MPQRLRLVIEWIFDQLILPLIESIIAFKAAVKRGSRKGKK